MSAAAIKHISLQSFARPTQRTWLTTACLAGSDLFAVALASGIALLRIQALHLQLHQFTSELAPALSAVLAFAALGLYPLVGISPAQEFRRILLGCGVVYGVATCGTLLEQGAAIASIGGLTFAWAVTSLSVMLCRALTRGFCARFSWWGTPTVILGSGSSARTVFRALRGNSQVGLKVVGVFDDSPAPWPELDGAAVQIGSTSDALEFARNAGVCHAVIAVPGLRRNDLPAILKEHARGFKHLLVIPDLAHLSSIWVEPRDIGGMLALHVTQTLRQPGPRFFKRAIDIVLTSIATLFLLPVFALLCAAVRLSSKGPIFYSHLRIGRDKALFHVWKFRTMYANADEILAHHLEKDQELRRQWEWDRKLKNDPRVTPLGRIMRKASLDELPQLWNVLTGDMSLVGPRPIVNAEIQRYKEHFDAYTSVRPGITGLWQVSGRNNTSYEERVQFDEYYVRNWSVWLDLYIIGRTVKTVLLGEGAY